MKAADKVGIQDFDLLQVIGKGSFGKVFQVRKKDTKKIYALKVLQKKVRHSSFILLISSRARPSSSARSSSTRALRRTF